MSEETAGKAETRERAAKVLREILEHMSVDAEVSAFDDGERIILDAHGAESGLVIGKKGQRPHRGTRSEVRRRGAGSAGGPLWSHWSRAGCSLPP